VIGHRDDRQRGLGGAIDEFFGSAPPVGRGGVKVEIDPLA
jgi:hypothetical protein